VNAEKVVMYRKSKSMRRVLDGARLLYPDGAGVVLAMRLKGIETARIPGAELWLEIIRQCPDGTPIALVGATKEVLAATVVRLQAEFPHVAVILARDGYSGCEDIESLGRELLERNARIVFLALGSPRQEELIARLRTFNPSAIYMGLGGSFDIYCGYKRRAPAWMRRASLEWLYRLSREPTRVLRQRRLITFAWLLLTRRL
jgi:UDP-N-acetyl-D-mannosaminouronate:lipid I N-acetyl-D-mannosaminouronosyltransferase